MEGFRWAKLDWKHQHRRQLPFASESLTWRRGLEPDLCRLRYQCEDMEKYLIVCYAARSANTVRKCKRLVSLPCVATCCMAQKGPLYVTESSAQPEKPRYGRQGQYEWKWNAAKWIWSAAAACRFAWRNW